MTETQNIERAADLLWDAANNKVSVDPVRTLIGENDIEAAYAVQKINTERRLARGEKRIGTKIGLTSFAVQEQLGVDQPDFGILYDSGNIADGKISASELMQGKAEAEIAFVLSKDLDKEVEMPELIEAIDHALISIEVVGSRVKDWNIRITDTIADNASASHYVLGNDKVDISDLDLSSCQMKLYKNGELASEGSGKACMDNPLNAALWLANFLTKRGEILRKGECILSGALGPMVNIESGDKIKAEISNFGEIQLEVVD